MLARGSFDEDDEADGSGTEEIGFDIAPAGVLIPHGRSCRNRDYERMYVTLITFLFDPRSAVLKTHLNDDRYCRREAGCDEDG